jgi:hypothetical protein
MNRWRRTPIPVVMLKCSILATCLATWARRRGGIPGSDEAGRGKARKAFSLKRRPHRDTDDSKIHERHRRGVGKRWLRPRIHHPRAYRPSRVARARATRRSTGLAEGESASHPNRHRLGCGCRSADDLERRLAGFERTRGRWARHPRWSRDWLERCSLRRGLCVLAPTLVARKTDQCDRATRGDHGLLGLLPTRVTPAVELAWFRPAEECSGGTRARDRPDPGAWEQHQRQEGRHPEEVRVQHASEQELLREG